MKSFNFGRLDTSTSQNNQATVVFVHGFTGDWKGTRGRIPERLWPKGTPMPTNLDDEGAITLAIGLERVGRSSDALDVLTAHKPHGHRCSGRFRRPLETSLAEHPQ